MIEVFQMGDYLEYKGYMGTVEYSRKDAILYGKVIGIRDLIMYEGESIAELKRDFRETIDEYLDDCTEDGRNPDKPFSGQLNTRVGHELHLALAMEAQSKNLSQSAMLKQILSERYEDRL